MTESKSEIDSIFVTTNGTANTTVNQDDSTSVPSSSITGTSAAPSNSADVTTTTVQAPQVITEANSIQLNGTNGPSLQKVVLEDIKLEDYYNETMEESLCKQFKFQITHNELKVMIENSVLETNTAKPYRYLTGNFIRVFERHVEVFEKQRIPIQKRNNVVYEESLRNNTVYMRVNGDCKLCPKANRVRYVFIIKQKPEPDEKYVEVEAKIRGTHQHDSNLSNISLDGLTSTPTTTSATNTSIATSTTGSSSQTTTPKSSHHSTARKHTSRLSLSVLNANSSSAGGNTISANSSDPNGETSVEKVAGGSNAKRPRLHKTETIQLDSSQINSVGSNFISTSPKSTVTPNSVNASTVSNSQFVATSAALNLLDKNVINQIANQISSKIMIKLDQINLKVNQISDRLYDLERKLDSVEVAEIQF